MAEIINVYREYSPALRFIGKRYSNADRGIDGSYSEKWCEWFQNDWFDALEGLKRPDIDNGHIGLCRCDWIDFESNFQYWIGMFLPAGTDVPPGYDFADFVTRATLAFAGLKAGRTTEFTPCTTNVSRSLKKEA